MNTWSTCEEWMEKIKASRLNDKGIVLTHNGFYYADAEEATGSNLITEEAFDRVIKQGAIDVAELFERTKPHAIRRTGSYTGKHIVEELKGYYMTNGEFILAVLCSGLVSEEWKQLAKGLAGNKRKVSMNISLPIRLKKVRY